jgi:hypothetical protein
VSKPRTAAEINTTGGIALPDGQVIASAGNSGQTIELWLYPGSERITFAVSDCIVTAYPPDRPSWVPNLTQVSIIIHQQDSGTYRLKLLATFWNGDGGGWDLAVIDTQMDLIRT